MLLCRSDARTHADATFVQTHHLLANLHRVKLPEGMGSLEEAGPAAVQVVTGVSVTSLLPLVSSAASGPTPQSVLLLWRKGAAAFPLPIEQRVLRVQHAPFCSTSSMGSV